VKNLLVTSLLISFCCVNYVSADTFIVRDGDTGLTKEEVRLAVDAWSPEQKQAATEDNAALYELLNQLMATKKMAQEAKLLTPEKDGDNYWRKEMVIMKSMQLFMMRLFLTNIDVPDMSDLSQARYKTQKKKYAWVAEKRQSSHILIACAPPQCLYETRAEDIKAVQAALATRSFEDVALTMSDDIGTRTGGGKLSLSIGLAEPGIDKAYRKALFELEKVGDTTEIVATAYGMHIIRLDSIEEGYYKPYAQVREDIVQELTNEYKKLKVSELNDSYRFTDSTQIDDAAIRGILEPQKN